MTNDTPAEPFLFRLNVEHTPSPNDPKGSDEFYRALGILIVAWGRLEGHFVTCLLTLLNLCGGEKLGQQLPMPWDKRAEMWRRGFEIIPELQFMKDEAIHLLTEIKDVASDRHAIVHALWEPFNRSSPPSAEIVKIKPKNKTTNGLEIARFVLTIPMLTEIGSKINRLNLGLIPISETLTRLRREQSPPPANLRRV